MSQDSLDILLKQLKLPAFRQGFREVAERAEAQGWSFVDYLKHLAELELSSRERRRIERNVRASKLPQEKTLGSLEVERFETRIRRQLPTRCEGGFCERAENVLLFGLPGRGKTHIACAIGHELIHRGYRVLFCATFRLVGWLLEAKRDLERDRVLRRLDRFDVVILDDIGYVQQDRSEMEVLFTFLAERYERKSVIITSHLVFSQWDQIFQDPMTTAAAIDRIVHHATILELNGSSYRTDTAQRRKQSDPKTQEEDDD